MKKILVINPGSTSTKIALYRDNEESWMESIEHSSEELKEYKTIYDQVDMRYELVIKIMKERGEDVESLSGIVARGGLLPPVAAGAYEVNEHMLEVLKNRPINHHASNLGAAIAYKIGTPLGIKSYIYDPVTVDEMIDIVRITGIKEIKRHGQGHNLNMRAAALRFCEENKAFDYRKANIIVAHLGGGITLSLHSQGRIIDMVSDDEGAFSPERAGALPTFKIVKYIFDNKLDYISTMKVLQRQGGLMSYFGVSDSRIIEERVKKGDQEAKLIYDAMALSVAKAIGKLAVVVNGKIDGIVLTGGIAYSGYFTDKITQRVQFIAPVTVIPGENEMEALARGVLRVLNGEETAKIYTENC